MGLIYVLKSSLINITFTIMTFFIFGSIFNVIERYNNKFIYSAFGRAGLIITAAIGTIIHELSHMIMCFIFRHKIKEVKLFRPFESIHDGLLGYVSHSYNKKSLYQNMGNFFIGIAPLIGGTLSIVLIFKLILPDTYVSIKSFIDIGLYTSNLESLNIVGFINLISKDVFEFIVYVFKDIDIISIRFFIFIFLMYSISSHMSLSYEDFKNSFSGLGALIVLNFIISILFMLFNAYDSGIERILIEYNVIMILLMLLGLFFSLITLGISFVIKCIIGR